MTRMVLFVALTVCVWAALACSGRAQAAERKEVRLLYDFEDGADLEEIKKASENGAYDIVQDNGVTSGKNCLRIVGKPTEPWVAFEIRGEKAKDWAKFDYFVMDVFTEREEKVNICLELWDAGAKNYATRCTFEDTHLHAGKNPLAWRINRAARNAKKDGLSWEEILPKDRIDMNGLTRAKIFFTPVKNGGNTVLWVDKLRLMQEDAVLPKINVQIPEGAKAYEFGNKATQVSGFTHVAPGEKGLSGSAVKVAGKAWPDPLTGDGLESDAGPFQFDAEVPDGEYLVWISAGKVLNENVKYPYKLAVGDQTLCDEPWSEKDFYGAKGLYRSLHTQFSQRPNALWLDYVLPVAPEQTVKAKATGGKLTLQVSNHRLAALVAMPAKDEAAFKKFCDEVREQRIKVFYNGLYFDPHEAPKKAEGDGAFAFWLPATSAQIHPWTSPGDEDRKQKKVELKAAPGQRAVVRACVTAYEDLGNGDLEVSDLTGPGTIPASNVRRYFQNYRVADTSVQEQGLLPWTKMRFEAGTTWAYWLWMQVPADAKAGEYKGTLTVKTDKGGSKSLPVELEVYPFKLDDNIPVSYGMYYGPWTFPAGVDRRKMIKEQLDFMREVGFTATCVGSGNVTGVNGGNCSIAFDPFMFELAKEAGMGRRPEQMQMANTLGIARKIGRTFLGMGANIDQNPGSEMAKPELKGLYVDAMKKFRDFVDKIGMPTAFETVDEPREVPNPWNRNLEHTNTYADWLHEAGPMKCFTTPMGDGQSGKDYTALADHHDIVSVHAYEGSKKLMEKVRGTPGKLLWFYNTGMDRLSWGFYAWRMNAVGRWEWHWSSDGGASAADYPCESEGYTPFTGGAEMAMRAPPYEYPGGFLFKSAYLRVSEGINDYTYLYNLEQAMEAAKADAGKAKTVEEAKAFLEALKKSIPEFPGIKNITSPEGGALVGAGLNTPVAELCGAWRWKIGEFLKVLKK